MEDKIIALFIAFISAFVAFRVASNEKKDDYVRKRYEEVIFPLFDLLEFFLFNEINETVKRTVYDATNLVQKHKMLAGGRLVSLIYYCNLNGKMDSEAYNNLCSYVNSEYDKSCRKLGIPLRPLRYRVDNAQYKGPWGIILFFIYGFGVIILQLIKILLIGLIIAIILMRILGVPIT